MERAWVAALAEVREDHATASGYTPHAVTRRFSPEQLRQILVEYQAGEGCTSLSRRYGISENAVLALLERAGVPRRPLGRFTPDDVAEMRRLRQAGWTYREIGEKFGVTKVAVSRRLATGRSDGRNSPR